MTPEGKLLHDILERHGARGDCRLFRRNVGKARDPQTGRVITFGTPGEPDLFVVARNGRVGWMELKSPTGRSSPAQRTFHAFLSDFGHRFAVVRSLDEAAAFLESLCSP